MSYCSTVSHLKHHELINSPTSVLLHRGRFASIHQTNDPKNNSRPVIVKTFDPANQLAVEQCRRELQTLQRANHVNLIRLVGLGPADNSSAVRFLLLECAESTLHDVIHKHSHVDYTLAHCINWMVQLGRGLSYLHNQLTLVHTDVKPTNLLLFARGQLIKLSDLELATPLRSPINASQSYTLAYAAPELFGVGGGITETLTEKCDVFSLALTLWELLARRLPTADYPRRSNVTVFWTVLTRRPNLLNNLPDVLWRLLQRCWSINPELRLPLDDLLQFFEFARDELLPDCCDLKLISLDEQLRLLELDIVQETS